MAEKSYLVIARKYRPTTFDEVIGQEAAATTLKNAVEANRVAHAYLFTGPRGVGKTSMARILAKALNCKTGPTTNPCNKCEACKRIDAGDYVDVVEIDGASNRGIDEIRALRENARYAPANSRYKIYVIDEVHMLTKDAFNALLKTLEEPPPHVKFIFATTEPHKVIDTIRSRCQRFDFRRIPTRQIAEHLTGISKTEKIEAEAGVIDAIARASHGGMRDAESLLDQLAAMTGAKISVADIESLTGGIPQKKLFDAINAIGSRDAKTALEIISDVLARGAAEDELIQQFIEAFRDTLLAKILGVESPLIDRTETDRAELATLSGKFTQESLMYLVQMFASAKQKARDSSQSRIVLELALIKASESADLQSLDEILRRLNLLERGGGRPSVSSDAPVSQPVRQQARRPEPEHTESAPMPPAEKTGDVWQDALNILGQKKKALADMLSGAATFRIEHGAGDRVRFIIETDRLGKIQAEANKQLIENALTEVSGKAGSLEAIEKAGQAAVKPASLFQPKGQHVKKAIDMFGGRIVDTVDRPAAKPADAEERE